MNAINVGDFELPQQQLQPVQLQASTSCVSLSIQQAQNSMDDPMENHPISDKGLSSNGIKSDNSVWRVQYVQTWKPHLRSTLFAHFSVLPARAASGLLLFFTADPHGELSAWDCSAAMREVLLNDRTVNSSNAFESTSICSPSAVSALASTDAFTSTMRIVASAPLPVSPEGLTPLFSVIFPTAQVESITLEIAKKRSSDGGDENAAAADAGKQPKVKRPKPDFAAIRRVTALELVAVRGKSSSDKGDIAFNLLLGDSRGRLHCLVQARTLADCSIKSIPQLFSLPEAHQRAEVSQILVEPKCMSLDTRWCGTNNSTTSVCTFLSCAANGVVLQTTLVEHRQAAADVVSCQYSLQASRSFRVPQLQRIERILIPAHDDCCRSSCKRLLAVAGFHAGDFVVRALSPYEHEMLRVELQAGHRSWDYSSAEPTSGQVYCSCSNALGSAGRFVLAYLGGAAAQNSVNILRSVGRVPQYVQASSATSTHTDSLQSQQDVLNFCVLEHSTVPTFHFKLINHAVALPLPPLWPGRVWISIGEDATIRLCCTNGSQVTLLDAIFDVARGVKCITLVFFEDRLPLNSPLDSASELPRTDPVLEGTGACISSSEELHTHDYASLLATGCGVSTSRATSTERLFSLLVAGDDESVSALNVVLRYRSSRSPAVLNLSQSQPIFDPGSCFRAETEHASPQPVLNITGPPEQSERKPESSAAHSSLLSVEYEIIGAMAYRELSLLSAGAADRESTPHTTNKIDAETSGVTTPTCMRGDEAEGAGSEADDYDNRILSIDSVVISEVIILLLT